MMMMMMMMMSGQRSGFYARPCISSVTASVTHLYPLPFTDSSQQHSR